MSARLRRVLSRLILRGPHAEFIAHDLEDLYLRDRGRGMPAPRAHWRFARDLVRSSFSVWRGDRGRARSEGASGMSLFSWPDIKLSARLMFKYPGLTLVASIGMAVAIAISAGTFAFFNSTLHPRIPLDEGDRIVGLENWNVAVNNEDRHSVHDFVAWRGEMRSVVDISAFRNVSANLVAGTAPPAIVRVAEMTASGFRLARVSPRLGRYLTDEDEREGAPPVLVIGYDAWRTNFGGDPSVIGRDVRLGKIVHTIVGVMPEKFGFPVNHRYWTPFRPDPLASPRGEGPELFIFGRLAPGVTMKQAEAELAAIGGHAAAAFPKTHAQLRPHVYPYTYPLLDIQDAGLGFQVGIQATVSVVLVVVALNIAILVYARTAIRRGEIAIRTALGASRARIVLQSFGEALVLALPASVVGLAIAQFGLRWGHRIMELELGDTPPFWAEYGLRPATVIYSVALLILAAVIVGVIPALQATRRSVHSDMRDLRGGSGMRLGKMWTALVVAQVAIAIAVLPAALRMGLHEVEGAFTQPTFAAEEFLLTSVTLESADGAAAPASKFSVRLPEVLQRLRADPEVAGVTFAAPLPGRNGAVRMEVEGAAASADAAAGVDVAAVGVESGYFGVYGAPILAGRGFDPRDAGDGSRAVIVNRRFVEKALAGANAVGRRVRYLPPSSNGGSAAAPSGPWYEIVGVVEDLRANRIKPDLVRPFLYYPVSAAQATVAGLTIRVRGGAPAIAGVTGRLRQIVGVDPMLRLGAIRTADATNRQEQIAFRLVGLVLTLVLGAVLLLSAAGMYALMSFTVSQRRREIGIRTALGAQPHRLLLGIFSRAATQIGGGVVLGVIGAMVLESASGGLVVRGATALIIPGIALLMTVVGIAAAFGPARRGLRIQPTESLRAE